MSLQEVVEAILEQPAQTDGKVVGPGLDTLPRRSLRDGRIRLSDLATPVAVLDASAIADNVHRLESWCRERGFRAAPHGKVTMSPQLWAQQIAAGAWGITVATTAQLRAALDWSVERIQFANPLLDRPTIDRLAASVARPDGPEVLTWVDSLAAVDALAAERPRPLRVLLDWGRPGGRTGVRSVAEAEAVIARAMTAPGVELAGTAGYEGAISGEGSSTTEVVDYVAELVDIHRTLILPHVRRDAVFSIGGSDRLDAVSAGIAGAVGISGAVGDLGTILIRAGVSIAHDDGLYRDRQALASADAPVFRAALRLVATVIALHEGVALLDAGRRDAGSDHGNPVPLELWRDGAVIDRTDGRTEVAALHDQHAFVARGTFAVDPRPGDRVLLGISHACTTFDRWRDIPTTEDAAQPDAPVTGLVRTFF